MIEKEVTKDHVLNVIMEALGKMLPAHSTSYKLGREHSKVYVYFSDRSAPTGFDIDVRIIP